jgi:hypothetical protein
VSRKSFEDVSSERKIPESASYTASLESTPQTQDANNVVRVDNASESAGFFELELIDQRVHNEL